MFGKPTNIICNKTSVKSKEECISKKNGLKNTNGGATNVPIEIAVKTSNQPRRRSRSAAGGDRRREPWAQLLTSHKTGKQQDSVFNNLDPLRTLHFLAKELQIQLQTLLPNENSLHGILKAIHESLNRIPPDLASAIHSQQQTTGLSSSEKLHADTDKKHDFNEQKTEHLIQSEEIDKMRKWMTESTMKMEAQCQYLGTICEQLKKDKIHLENQLENERSNVEYLREKLEDTDIINRDLIRKLAIRDEEIKHLRENIKNIGCKMTNAESSKPAIKSLMDELQQSKAALEQECNELKHQLQISAIEREKYVAILAVRDRQIQKICGEMTQLQITVNEQLSELHGNALLTIPSNPNDHRLPLEDEAVKDDLTISSIHPE